MERKCSAGGAQLRFELKCLRLESRLTAWRRWLTYALPLGAQLARCRKTLLAQLELDLKCLRLGDRLTAWGWPERRAVERDMQE